MATSGYHDNQAQSTEFAGGKNATSALWPAAMHIHHSNYKEIKLQNNGKNSKVNSSLHN